MRAHTLACLLPPLLALSAPAVAATASEPLCTLERIVELPVTMAGSRPMAAVTINGKEARFFLDSGAFFGVMSAESAKRLGARVGQAPSGFIVRGVGGSEVPQVATVKEIKVGPAVLNSVDFLTTASGTLGDADGVIGQNLLWAFDVEYDLANGVVRLFHPSKGCDRRAPRAYWSKTFSAVDIEPTTVLAPHLIAQVTVNGHKFRAMFDTGAGTSALALKAAARIGITPQSPGIVAAGMSGGFGPRRFETWIAPVDSFSVGDETVQHTRMRIGDMDLGGMADLLVGPDFFLSHRIYFAKDQNKLYLTYNGGPVFNLTVTGAGGGGSPSATPRAGEASVPVVADGPTDADGFARRAAASASRRDFVHAIADYGRAVELDPKVAKHLYGRATARLSNGDPVLAMADLTQALQLQPDYTDALLTRGTLYLSLHDESRARPDFEAALRLAPPTVQMRLLVAAAYERAMQFEPAVGQFDKWIEEHPKDPRLADVLNGRCWARGLWGHDLDKAAADCDAALKLRPHTSAYLDSRGLVRVRQGQLDQAIVDYDEALKLQPKQAWSLYMRGVAKRRKGLKAEGDADIAAAAMLDANTSVRGKQYGLEP